jgi:hypothetical protein
MATRPIDAYSALLQRPEWKRKRMEIMERDGFVCTQCKAPGTPENYLQVDHKLYMPGSLPWEISNSYLQTVCVKCHKRFTELRRRVQELIGEMNMYELPAAVDMLEGFWGNSPKLVESRLRADRVEATARPLELIQIYEVEKQRLLDMAYSTARSRRAEELDEMIDAAWGRIQRAN